MATIYLETTIPSYLAARPSRDIIVAAQQQITMDWWETCRFQHELFISEAVLEECKAGDKRASKRRTDILDSYPLLKISGGVVALAEKYAVLLEIPEKAKVDAVHLSLAVFYEMDYLLTWNCKHLAHGEVRMKINHYNHRHALHEPMIVTPLELMERG